MTESASPKAAAAAPEVAANSDVAVGSGRTRLRGGRKKPTPAAQAGRWVAVGASLAMVGVMAAASERNADASTTSEPARRVVVVPQQQTPSQIVVVLPPTGRTAEPSVTQPPAATPPPAAAQAPASAAVAEAPIAESSGS